MVKFNSNLNNLFNNFKQMQQYAKKAFDVNGSGRINSKDSDALLKKEETLLKKKALFDVNGDGNLNQNDIDLFMKGDVNGDGIISDDEKAFIEMYTNSFEKGIVAAAKGKKNSSFYLNGLLYKSGVAYNSSGKIIEGFYKDLYYKKGVLYTGKVNGITYKDGVAMTIDKIPLKEYSSIKDIDFTTLQQSSNGECGPLSSIMALYSTPNGKKLIDNAVKKDKDENYIVTLKDVGGTPKNYMISAAEIKKYRPKKNEGGSFAVGDDVILAIEIANAKADGVMDDMAVSSDLKYRGLVYDKAYTETSLMSKLGASVITYSKEKGTLSEKKFQDVINKASGGKNAIVINTNGTTINCIVTPSGTKSTYKSVAGHFIAVTGISADGKTVTLTDSDPTKGGGSVQYKVSVTDLYQIISFIRYTK